MKELAPKQEFLRDPESVQFAEHISKPIVRRGISTALMQFVVEQGIAKDFSDGTRFQFELQGAKKFIEILINLTEVEQPKKPDDSGKLQWQLKPPSPRPRQPRKPTPSPPASPQQRP